MKLQPDIQSAADPFKTVNLQLSAYINMPKYIYNYCSRLFAVDRRRTVPLLNYFEALRHYFDRDRTLLPEYTMEHMFG